MIIKYKMWISGLLQVDTKLNALKLSKMALKIVKIPLGPKICILKREFCKVLFYQDYVVSKTAYKTLIVTRVNIQTKNRSLTAFPGF